MPARAKLGLYVVSAALHGGLAAALAAVEPPPRIDTVHITMREVSAPLPLPPEAPTPEPPPLAEAAPAPPSDAPPPPPRPARESRPQTAEAPPPAGPTPPPDFGVALTGGPGLSGIAVPEGSPSGTPTSTPRVRTATRTLEATPAAHVPSGNGCETPASKPRVITLAQPAYTEAARAAGVSGRVRLQITVGADGSVSSVNVLEGLGFGLDEAALEAARAARFEPALACGEPTQATFNIRITFAL